MGYDEIVKAHKEKKQLSLSPVDEAFIEMMPKTVREVLKRIRESDA